jgi:hypothetical protein
MAKLEPKAYKEVLDNFGRFIASSCTWQLFDRHTLADSPEDEKEHGHQWTPPVPPAAPANADDGPAPSPDVDPGKTQSSTSAGGASAAKGATGSRDAHSELMAKLRTAPTWVPGAAEKRKARDDGEGGGQGGKRRKQRNAPATDSEKESTDDDSDGEGSNDEGRDGAGEPVEVAGPGRRRGGRSKVAEPTDKSVWMEPALADLAALGKTVPRWTALLNVWDEWEGIHGYLAAVSRLDPRSIEHAYRCIC